MSTANDSLPRVSTILRVLDDSYAGVPQAAMDKAAERGEHLHRLCLSYLASLDGMCDAPVEVRADYAPAYLSFVKWVMANQVSPIAVEQGSSSLKYGYRGTPDALITYGPHQLKTLLDLKFTAAIMRTNRVQVQAYWRLDLYQEAERVMLLHIKPLTGELKAHKITKNPHDWAAFLNALSVWKWRQQ